MDRAPTEHSSWSIYCRACFYDLRGLPESRCPECGLAFNPDKPETYSRSPGPERLRDLVRRAKSKLKESSHLLLPPDPQMELIARLSRKVAALTVENDQLWDHFVWLLGIMMEKGIVTEKDVVQQVMREEWGTLPMAGNGEMEIVDDTPSEAEPEPEPTQALLDLEEAAADELRRGKSIDRK